MVTMSTIVDQELEIVWLDQQRNQNIIEPDHLQRRVDLDHLVKKYYH